MSLSQAVKTTLNYYPTCSVAGRQIVLGTIGTYRRPMDPRPATIQDVRGRESTFNLDVHGFQFLRHPSPHVSSFTESVVKKYMYPEAVDILKQATGATRAHVFSHITRNAPYEKVEELVASKESDTKPTSMMVPGRLIHVDQSESGALDILKDNMSAEEVARLSRSRWGIVNIWRPLKPVPRDPLAVADARSVRDEDLVEVYARLPGKGEKNYEATTQGAGFGMLYGMYGEGQKWYYLSGMRPDEVMLIKCFDSKDDGSVARRSPHTAFVDPRTQEVKEARESVELRCLVFFEDQTV
ncbi:GA4 desaturase family protein [Aspergillus steynii IBT 23096]|uniref:GA4 desaturase family protein n=1 Tax=Aspergillus steynii IBT 23096 TaxID=1392250 RepID=A0A2I2G0N4_9EURO|nr:GA4 desaturase family protein [Aspergillus steynii IBT 23096]PLB46423.1 GA4 desaturase family protein [Aspergillus steynii IBT 23096]